LGILLLSSLLHNFVCTCILSFMNNEALHCLEAMKITNFEENLHQ
jgi:hypothetical protein